MSSSFPSAADLLFSSSSSNVVRPQVTRRRGTLQSLNKSLGRLSLSHLDLKFFRISRRRQGLSSTTSNANPSANSDKETEDVIALPYDIILVIADLLHQSDLFSLCLTSRPLHDLLLPLLYHTVILRSSASCVSFLTLMTDLESPKSTRLCGYLRELAVRPNYYLAWPEPEGVEGKGLGKGKIKKGVDEAWVVDKIVELAPKLHRLDTFDWDGCEMPKEELWVALQEHCSNLRTVYSNVGYKSLNPDSALFSFSNLVAFSLTVRHGLSTSFPLNPNPNPNGDFTPLEPLPPKLWDMLIQRCPELEELTLCSFSSAVRNFDVQPLFISSTIWDSSNNDGEDDRLTITNQNIPLPKLNALTLGTFGYTEDFSLTPPMPLLPLGLLSPFTSSLSLGSFLLSHTELKYLRFSWNFRRWLSPHNVPIFFPPHSSDTELILPHLTTFSGIYQHLHSLPDSTLANIQMLDLTSEPIYEDRVDALCGVLGLLKGLRELDIWVHIDFTSSSDSQYPDPSQGLRRGFRRRLSIPFLGASTANGDEVLSVPSYEHVFTRILSLCSGVEDLHWMSTTPIGPQPLASLARSLGLMKRLKSFSLTKGHSYRDEFSFGLGPLDSLKNRTKSSKGGSMLKSALTLINAAVSLGVPLEQVNIRWARENCPNHLKQEGIYDVVRNGAMSQGTLDSPEKEKEEMEREIVGVDVFERGITMPGGVFKRRYRYYSHPNQQKDQGKVKTKANGLIGHRDKGKGKEKEGVEVKGMNAEGKVQSTVTEDFNDEDGNKIGSPKKTPGCGKRFGLYLRRLKRRSSSPIASTSADGLSSEVEVYEHGSDFP